MALAEPCASMDGVGATTKEEVRPQRPSFAPTEAEVEEEPRPSRPTSPEQDKIVPWHHEELALERGDGWEPDEEDLPDRAIVGAATELHTSQVWDFPLTRAEKHLRLAQLLDSERAVATTQSCQQSKRLDAALRDVAFLEEGLNEAQRTAEQQQAEIVMLHTHIEQMRLLTTKVMEHANLPDGVRTTLDKLLAKPVPWRSGAGADCGSIGNAKPNEAVKDNPEEAKAWVRELYSALGQLNGDAPPAPSCGEADRQQVMALEDISLMDRAHNVLMDLCSGWVR